jgi:hypothetical protein
MDFRITFSLCSFKIREMKDVLEWAILYNSVGLIKRQMSGEIQRIADVKILQLNSMHCSVAR